jgi:hypothetical protein
MRRSFRMARAQEEVTRQAALREEAKRQAVTQRAEEEHVVRGRGGEDGRTGGHSALRNHGHPRRGRCGRRGPIHQPPHGRQWRPAATAATATHPVVIKLKRDKERE